MTYEVWSAGDPLEAFHSDRESTCAWTCVRPYPHDGPCSPTLLPAAVLTAEDREAIAQGIENFIMNGDPNVDSLWRPYVDKLRSLPAPPSTGTEQE